MLPVLLPTIFEEREFFRATRVRIVVSIEPKNPASEEASFHDWFSGTMSSAVRTGKWLLLCVKPADEYSFIAAGL